MDSRTCQSCKYFIQHYYLDSRYATTVYCGHCCQGRVKHRKPGSPACKHYAVRTTAPDLPNQKVMIHYLTTEFLKKTLQMELPPKIQDGG